MNEKIGTVRFSLTKRIFAIMLTICIAVGLMPCMVSAAGERSGECGAQGDNVTWTLDENGKLTIKGTGEMADYVYEGARPYGNSMTSVVIEDGVTSIGEYAFYECRNLENITIPDSVTDIGGHAFHNCESLKGIVIPEGVTKINDVTFYGCKALESAVLPDGITELGYSAFYSCEGLTKLELPGSVTIIGQNAFKYCKNLSEINIPDGVKEISSSAFEYCESITEIEIPDSVKKIGYSAFYFCLNLKSLVIPDSVTEIGTSAFRGCRAMTELKLPRDITQIPEQLCQDCSSLAEIIIPNKVTDIDFFAFLGCGELTSVTLPSSVTSLAYQSFDECEKLSDIYYSGTEEMWKNNGMSEYFYPLDNITVHYSSAPVVSIETLEELEAFRDSVNNGVSYEGICVILYNDIDMSEKYGEGKETWTPIGTEEHPFNGTFNGLGHTINLSVYQDYDNVSAVSGLFGYTETASTIEMLNVSGNITVLGTIIMGSNPSSGRYIGSVVGYNKGTIKNCSNMAAVAYTGNGGYAGGIAGKTDGSIVNCYNIGNVKICGQDGEYIAYAKDNSLIQNCYYLSETEDENWSNGIYGKTAEQFASGEVTYFLNGGIEKVTWDYTPTWYQNIGEDTFPLLDRTHSVVMLSYDEEYYNPNITSDNKIKAYPACISGGSEMENAYEKAFSYDEFISIIPEGCDWDNITERYDETFFENKFLYIKGFAGGSSGTRYEVTSIQENENDISVEMIKKSPGYSDDITSRVLIVEADKSLSDKELKINYIPYNVKYYDGRPQSQKDFLPEDNFRLDYDIITSKEELDEVCDNNLMLVNAYSDGVFNNNSALLIISWQECQQARTHKISSIKYSQDSGFDIVLSRCMPENEFSPDVMTDYCAAIIISKYDANAKVKITLDENKSYPYEITALRFTDVSGNEISMPKQGKSFIVETDIVKTEERNEKDYLFVAVYDEDGILMSLDYVKAKFTVDGECSFGFNIPAQSKKAGSVKAFVWNTFNSMSPLAQAKTLSITEQR